MLPSTTNADPPLAAAVPELAAPAAEEVVPPLLGFLEACEGRCVGAHLGTYDFTASCNITAAYQVMDHRLCDLHRQSAGGLRVSG